jgi:hypothetical protein
MNVPNEPETKIGESGVPDAAAAAPIPGQINPPEISMSAAPSVDSAAPPPPTIPDVNISAAPSAPVEESGPPAPPTGGEEQEFPVFLVIPSTFSYLFSVLIILVMFLIYIISIGSIASFQSKFTPNFYMLWDFITTGNTEQYRKEFQDYLNNMILTTTQDSFNGEDTFVGSRYNQNPLANKFPYETELYDKVSLIAEKLQKGITRAFAEAKTIWNQLLLNSMLQKGNTIKVSRNL